LESQKNNISFIKRYLDLREKALKYTNEDMNLKLQNNEQVYLAVFDIPLESNLSGFHRLSPRLRKRPGALRASKEPERARVTFS